MASTTAAPLALLVISEMPNTSVRRCIVTIFARMESVNDINRERVYFLTVIPFRFTGVRAARVAARSRASVDVADESAHRDRSVVDRDRRRWRAVRRPREPRVHVARDERACRGAARLARVRRAELSEYAAVDDARRREDRDDRRAADSRALLLVAGDVPGRPRSVDADAALRMRRARQAAARSPHARRPDRSRAEREHRCRPAVGVVRVRRRQALPATSHRGRRR
jgi:hypothetical protein